MLPHFGGHISHVDAVGEITERISVGRAWEFWVSVPADLTRYIAEIITVDGVSLTVNALRKVPLSSP